MADSGIHTFVQQRLKICILSLAKDVAVSLIMMITFTISFIVNHGIDRKKSIPWVRSLYCMSFGFVEGISIAMLTLFIQL